MNLSGSQKKALQEALLSAFRRSSDLNQMVSFGLDENLEAIAGTGALEDVIFELIEWAEGRGRMEDLLRAAQKGNPTNPDLAAFMETLERPNDQDKPPAAHGLLQVEETSPSVVRSQPETVQRSSSGGQDPDVAELYRQLVKQFNLEELTDLCFDLGIDIEDLGGTGRKAKARELVKYMERRGRLADLRQGIREQD